MSLSGHHSRGALRVPLAKTLLCQPGLTKKGDVAMQAVGARIGKFRVTTAKSQGHMLSKALGLEVSFRRAVWAACGCRASAAPGTLLPCRKAGKT